MPEPIHTPADGLYVREVKIPVRDGEIPGYIAAPERPDHCPIVLVVQEIFGVHEYIRDVCRRLAKLGYCAIAPELYVRQGNVSGMTDHKEIMEKVVSRVPDEQVMADLDAAADFAARSAGADASRLGITGFCWGGRIVWLYAAHNPRLAAAVAWYGRLTGPTDDLHPRNPLDVAPELKCPVLGLYGAQDQSIPVDSVTRMRDVLSPAHRNAEIIVYPEAGHAFHADYRPMYNKHAAEDGWFRMRRWFEQYLSKK